MKNIKPEKWIIGWMIIVVILLSIAVAAVIYVDPYFHYHAPLTDRYYYKLYNERSQNDGIIRHFDYDALIVGNSFMQNTKTSEIDELFDVKCIKIPFSGSTYREMNDNVTRAIKRNPNLKMVIRVITIEDAFDDKDSLSWELGDYPFYLYDETPVNDVKYVLNGDVLSRVCNMFEDSLGREYKPGIDSFDSYSNWMSLYDFGINAVASKGVLSVSAGEPVHMTDEEMITVHDNIVQNMSSIADENPEITFYYYITPNSILYWRDKVEDGTVYKFTEAERMIIEECLKYENIHLFSVNNETDIVTDLNNYKDKTHYGIWVNSHIIRCMKEGRYLLTEDNYEEYLKDELDFYLSYDYSQLNDQIDYEDDDDILQSDIFAF